MELMKCPVVDLPTGQAGSTLRESKRLKQNINDFVALNLPTGQAGLIQGLRQLSLSLFMGMVIE